MAQSSSTEVCGLNLNANPHPPQTYPRLLQRASRFTVKARGSDYAKITRPTKSKEADNLFSGRILVWTDIDLKGRWLDIEKEDDLPEDVKLTINIPLRAKPNYRTFDYVLDEKTHIMWFQTKNEFGERLGSTTAVRIMALLLNPETLGSNYPEVSVAIVPEAGALDQILALPRLGILTVRVTRPNADVSSAQAKGRVFGTLNSMHAAQLELRLKKARGASKLTLTPEYQELAQVAADTGFVQGEEIGGDGKRHTLSTEELPRRIQIEDDGTQSFISRLRSKLHL